MGLTFLAAGGLLHFYQYFLYIYFYFNSFHLSLPKCPTHSGCMPEGISSVLMIRKGEGGVGVSNSLGANSLAILMSLGIPWLIKNSLNQNVPGKQSILLNPYSTEYNILILLFAVIALYIILTLAKYRLKRTVGIALITVYLVFITLGVLLEINVFFPDLICS